MESIPVGVIERESTGGRIFPPGRSMQKRRSRLTESRRMVGLVAQFRPLVQLPSTNRVARSLTNSAFDGRRAML